MKLLNIMNLILDYSGLILRLFYAYPVSILYDCYTRLSFLLLFTTN
jgi:hypothetical protein